MRAPDFSRIAILGLVTLVKGAAMDRRTNPVDSCTQIDLDELGWCIDSALSVFSVTYQNGDTSSFDYAGIASEINSLQSGLTSLGVTLNSFLPDPSSFAKTAQPGSTYAGPYVSDIISSYSEYTETRTDSTGSVFSFETSRFTPEPAPSTTTTEPSSAETSASLSSDRIVTSTTAVPATITSSASLVPISDIRSTSSNAGQAALATSSVGGACGTRDSNTGLAALAIFLLLITASW